MAALHMGIQAYQQDHQADVIRAIHGMAAEVKMEEIVELILQHRLPKPEATIFT